MPSEQDQSPNPLTPRRKWTRRHMLAVGLIGGAASTLPLGSTTSAKAQVSSLWPGHQPGSTYIGLNGVSATLDYPEAVERWYQQWSSDSNEDGRIRTAHQTDRLPWVSFKPPTGGWPGIVAGQYDGAIRAKARRYASYTQPVLTTFHHEPWNNGTPLLFEQAYFHILDVMLNEVNDLNQTTMNPILNGFNLHQPALGGQYFASGQFAERCPFIAFDNYGKAPALATCINALKNAGVKSSGIGEFGRGPAGDSGQIGDTRIEFQQKLDLMRDERDFLSVVCYWNQSFQSFHLNPYPNGSTRRRQWSSYQTETVRLSDL